MSIAIALRLCLGALDEMRRRGALSFREELAFAVVESMLKRMEDDR